MSMLSSATLRRFTRKPIKRSIRLTSSSDFRKASISSKTAHQSDASSFDIPQAARAGVKRFDEPRTTVKINEEGEDFAFDEEPLTLTVEEGHGYWPMLIGHKLDKGNLEIVRKLGWAGYSSVWLARVYNDSYPAKYVAVKILTANATAGVVYGELPEVDALTSIRYGNKAGKEASKKPDHPGFEHCLKMYNTFIEESHQGPHVCIVSNVLGANVGEFAKAYNKERCLSVPLTKRITQQTLLALDYLHRTCERVHTDIKPENILVLPTDADKYIDAQLKESPSSTYEPKFEPDLSPDPIITVKSQPLSHLGINQKEDQIDFCLIDFGYATSTDEVLMRKAQPDLLRAPEVIFGHRWSTPIDIWSLGCIIFELLTGAPLFQLHEYGVVTTEDTHLRRIIEFIGPFQRPFLEGCLGRADFFDEQDALLRVKHLVPKTIEECIRNYKVLEDKDIAPAANFIRKCLTIDPSERPSAMTLLNDEWLKGL